MKQVYFKTRSKNGEQASVNAKWVGTWYISYNVKDNSDNKAAQKWKTIIVKDTQPPVVRVHGDKPHMQECGNPYQEGGADATDSNDGDVPVQKFGGGMRSCLEIKQSNPSALSGDYLIEAKSINNGKPLRVYCDMVTDGGGYTYYAVDDGIPTTDRTQPNSCDAIGLQMVIWRTEAQQASMVQKYGADYFKTVPGVYGTQSGVSYANYAMNSAVAEVSKDWKALDGGDWFLRGSKYAEPDEEYSADCWLRVLKFNPLEFHDSTRANQVCPFSTGKHYVCSTNDKTNASDKTGKGVLPPQPAGIAKNYPPVNVPGEYVIYYKAHDKAQNEAVTQMRTIKVQDTVAPKIELVGNVQIQISPIETFSDPGATCKDACDQSLKPITKEWNKPISKTNGVNDAGVYIITYKCSDASKNAVTIQRSVVVIDKNQPKLELLGNSPLTIEAGPDVKYSDPGAKCVDEVDGNISHSVVITGTIVNPDTVGKYTLIYRCADTSGNEAPQQLRDVYVVDTGCPKIFMKGDQTERVEAGLPWHDPGATAFDGLDGDITSKIRTVGDTITHRDIYKTKGSCAEIIKSDPTVKSGNYHITVKDPQGKLQVREVFCDMTTDGGGYTMMSVDGGLSTSKASDEDSCKKMGLQMVIPRSKNHFEAMITYYGTKYFSIVPGIVGEKEADFRGEAMNSQNVNVASFWKAIDGGSWYLRDNAFSQPSGKSAGGRGYTPGCWMSMFGWDKDNYKFDDDLCAYSTDTYLCSTNDKGGRGIDPHNSGIISNTDSGAEVGVYYLRYYVTDLAGNDQCAVPSRTVIVKDTLPPVITLKRGGIIINPSLLEQAHGSSSSSKALFIGSFFSAFCGFVAVAVKTYKKRSETRSAFSQVMV